MTLEADGFGQLHLRRVRFSRRLFNRRTGEPFRMKFVSMVCAVQQSTVYHVYCMITPLPCFCCASCSPVDNSSLLGLNIIRDLQWWQSPIVMNPMPKTLILPPGKEWWEAHKRQLAQLYHLDGPSAAPAATEHHEETETPRCVALHSSLPPPYVRLRV